jgi:N-acetylglutamate synthase-like GNAT family acetyltransferase
MTPTTWRRGAHEISTEFDRLDLDVVHGYLTTAYWSSGIPRELVERAARNSLAFGIYERDGDGGATRQVGYARVITDRATFAYLADVFVLEAHRGRGLARWLMEVITAHPELQGLRRWLLVTRDAHGLYERFGFGPPPNPGGVMVRARANPYGAG